MSYDIIVLDPVDVPTGPAPLRRRVEELLLGDEVAGGPSAAVCRFREAATGQFADRVRTESAGGALVLTFSFADGTAALPEVTRLAARHGLATHDYSGSGRTTLPPRRPETRTQSASTPATAVARLLGTPARTGQTCRTRGL